MCENANRNVPSREAIHDHPLRLNVSMDTFSFWASEMMNFSPEAHSAAAAAMIFNGETISYLDDSEFGGLHMYYDEAARIFIAAPAKSPEGVETLDDVERHL